jgi:hypothetical protein
MTQNEKKVFLMLIVLTFGFLFSGYTIRNAEYMTMAEKYTERLKDIPLNELDVDNIDDILVVKENINNTKDQFLDEIQTKYSSKWSDKVLLGISYRKFDKNFNRIMSVIEKRHKKILYSNGGNLISFSYEEKEEENSPQITMTSEVEIKNESEEILEKSAKLEYVNFSLLQSIDENTDFISVLHNSESENMLVASISSKTSDIRLPEEYIEYEKYKNVMASDFIDSTFFKVERPSMWENGKSFIAGEIRFVWDKGRYNILSENTRTWADNIIVRLENGFDMYGKALIYDGKSFIHGVWINGEDGNINYFDNFGKTVTLSGTRLWVSICDEGELKI